MNANFYLDLFRHYQSRDRDAIILSIRPELTSWARDVLTGTHQEDQEDWLCELAAAGTTNLVSQVAFHLYGPGALTFDSGEHLLNWLRQRVKKEMRRSRHEMLGPVRPNRETIRKRLKRGEGKYRPYDPVRPLELRDPSQGSSNEESEWPSRLQEQFFVSGHDPRRDRYRRFVLLACNAAVIEAQQLGWHFVELIWTHRLSISKTAKVTGIPRSTIDGRLRRLAGPVAASATSELDELGREFLGIIWICAVKIGGVGHRNNRGKTCDPWGNAA